MTWDTSKIWTTVQEKGDIDDMIFASENKELQPAQIHSDR